MKKYNEPILTPTGFRQPSYLAFIAAVIVTGIAYLVLRDHLMAFGMSAIIVIYVLMAIPFLWISSARAMP